MKKHHPGPCKINDVCCAGRRAFLQNVQIETIIPTTLAVVPWLDSCRDFMFSYLLS
jgi:hypothetical protein